MQTAITLLGGLGMFLYGMTVMGEGLPESCRKQIKKNNRKCLQVML